MHRRRLTISAAVVVALLAAVVVAPAATAVPGAYAADKNSDSAIAKAGLLQSTDFPAGWTQAKHKDPTPTGIASCKAIEQVQARGKKYRAQSADFGRGQDDLALNAVYVYPTAAQAKAYLRPFEATNAPTCLEQRVRKAVKNVPGATVQVQKLDLSSALQSGTIDDAVGYGFAVGAPDQNGTPQQLDLVGIVVRIGRAAVNFSTQSNGQVLPETDALINASLSRLEQALR
jgi:hypothetical protein